MCDQSLPFRSNNFMSKLRQDYRQRVSTFAEDLSRVYELRVKVDRANREFKEKIGKQIDQLMLLHSEILQEADAIRKGDSLLLTEQDLITFSITLAPSSFHSTGKLVKAKLKTDP
ncbi:hypothetical protein FMEXI_2843 [Fusarium mexicanum]|uniref:Uncharacterized protein n=1 Tax=Fusarium mexicanum TaxID=751941 RepID=A0A8H5JD62_9HYPO|nr:hypothetical protein FMEXI_2843 [Fusarium mexicanum]